MQAGFRGSGAAEHRPTFTEVLRTRGFAVLFGAEIQSVVGDQLARVALSVLVFRRTDSATATALTYAATFLPAILGGALLAGVGDRFSRRAVMVVTDVLRAVLFAAMAVDGVPLPAVITLLVVAVFVGPAFTAAEVSSLADLLGEERFRVATGLRMAANQSAQVLGFAVGGAAVAALGPRGALLLDGGTYLLSAIVIGVLLPRPSSRQAEPDLREQDDAASGGSALRNRQFHMLVGLCWLAGFFVVPEGLAVPFAHTLGASTGETGVLFAAIPFGSALGTILVLRTIAKRRRLLAARWMAIAAGLPLLVSAAHPNLAVALATWTLCGLFAAYQLEVMTAIVHAIPSRARARIVGRVSAGLITAQGIGLAGFGIVAEWIGSGRAIAVAGVVGTLVALVLAAYGRAPNTNEDRPPSVTSSRAPTGR
jgi:predicted MFS family arabinose efflux permease